MVDSNPTMDMEPGQHLRVPLDIVPGIMAASEPPAISALMKTCYALYVEGPKHLLRHGVVLDSAHRTILFARFMLTAKDSSRFTHFRKLDLRLRFPLDSPCAQRVLIDLLSHPSLSLETVIVEHTSGLFDRSPYVLAGLWGGLGTIQTLRHLVALRVGEGSVPLIQFLPSRLESLTIGIDTHTGSRLGVMSMLKPFSDTLRTLLIKWTPSSLPPLARTDVVSCRFPLVRTLGVVVHDFSVLDLLASPAFAQTFPAVSHLQLIPADPPTTPCRLHTYREPPVSRLVAIREGNRALRSQGLDTSTRPTPLSPKECSGALYDVYASGLDCSLSTLHLWQHVLVRDLDLLRTVLKDTRAQHLRFSTRVEDVRQVLDVLDALKTHTPPHIDMMVSIARSSWLSRLLKGPHDMVNRSFLETSLRNLPTGLVELNLIIDVSAVMPLEDSSAARDALEGFTCWASKAAPDVTLTCRLAAEEDWKWPDLGQGDDAEHSRYLISSTYHLSATTTLRSGAAKSPRMVNPMRDGDWRLSFDVVSSIMAASPPPTISALMQSCHALYADGPRHLLRDGVRLDSELRVIQFTNFMLTRDPSRLAQFRKLELAFSFPFPLLFSDGTRQRLGQLLLHPALALETLTLRGAALVLSRNSLSDTILCSAFGKLSTLKHVVLHGVGAESGPIIQGLPSKLESAAIGVDRPLIEGPGWARFDVLSALRPFAGTLRTMLVKLQLSYPARSLLANGGSYSFPLVQTFGIVCDDSTFELLASPAFAQTFPALTHLQLIPPTLDRHGRGRRRRLEAASWVREASQGWRAQNPRGGAFPALASLAECSGRLFDVYALALDEPLATLRLWQHVVPADLPVLRAVLGDTRPGRLCLGMQVGSLAHAETTFAALRAVLAGEGQPQRRVDLTLTLSPEFWRSIFLKEAKFPGFLHLLTGLVINSGQPPPPDMAELNLAVEEPPEFEAHPAVRARFNTGLAAVAKWVAGAAPSLRFWCGTAVDGGDPECRWPDLGQDEARENPFGILNTLFDDDDDDDDEFDDGDEGNDNDDPGV